MNLILNFVLIAEGVILVLLGFALILVMPVIGGPRPRREDALIDGPFHRVFWMATWLFLAGYGLMCLILKQVGSWERDKIWVSLFLFSCWLIEIVWLRIWWRRRRRDRLTQALTEYAQRRAR